MEVVKDWLDTLADLKNGYKLDESEAARGKFSICCHVQVEGGKTFILKRSIVGEMEPRGGMKWVRDVRSLAAEFDFYEEYCKVRQGNSTTSNIPKLVASLSNFNHEEDSPENLFAKKGSDYKPRDDLVFALLLEDLGADTTPPKYHQLANGLSSSELPEFIDSLAKFHADTAQFAHNLDKDKTTQTNIWSLGGFWTKDKRQDFDKEVAGISARWEAFYALWSDDIKTSIENDQFGIINTLSNLLGRENIQVKDAVKELIPKLGSELSRHCQKLSEVVEKEERISVVHGDNKVANIFYSSEAEEKFKWIDFQWAGFGSPTLDLVYIVAGSVQDVESLENTLERLLRAYWEQFDKLIEPSSTSEVSSTAFDRRFTNFKFGFLDYCRVVLGYMWDGKLSKPVVEAREGRINFCLHNRSVKHVCWLTQKIVQYLIELQLVNLDDK